MFAVLTLTLFGAMVLANVVLAQETQPPAPPAEKTIQGTSVPAGGTALQGKGLPSAGTDPQRPRTPAAVVMEVKFENNLLSVNAENADLAALLQKISSAAGIAVDVGSGVSGSVSVSFSELKVEDGINRVLEVADSKNYAATFEKSANEKEGFRLGKVSVVRKAPSPSIAANVPPDVTARQAMEGHLLKKYGTKWWVRFRRSERKFDDIRGRIPGVSFPGSKVEARELAERILEDNKAAFASHLGTVAFLKVHESTESYIVGFKEQYQGVDVYQGGLTVTFFKITGEIGIFNGTHPDISLPTVVPKLTAEEAAKLVEPRFRAFLAQRRAIQKPEVLNLSGEQPRYHAKLEILTERVVPGVLIAHEYHLVWSITHPFGAYAAAIDAQSGEIINEGTYETPEMAEY